MTSRPPSLTAVFAAVVGIVALGISTGAEVPVAVQLVTLATLVGVVGLPHGALDPLVARHAGLVESPSAMGRYLAEYVALAVTTAVAWWLVPSVALPVFLVVSAHHFGGDWPPLGSVGRTLTGATVVGGPIALHPDAAADLLAPLASAATADLIVDAVGRAAPTVLALTVIAVVVQRSGRAALELGLVLAIAWIAPPLVAFAVYFCALHSPRHIGEVLEETGTTRAAAVRTALFFTSITVAGAALVWWAAPTSLTSPSDTLLRIVFVGLAALTVPHMRTTRQARLWRTRRPSADTTVGVP